VEVIMSIPRVLITGAFAVVSIGAAAPATDPPAVTSFVCKVGDTWTFQYTAKSVRGAGLNGSETWTRTACGDRYVAHPTGQLIKPDLIADPDGNYYAGYSTFTGAALKYNKPLPLARLPLEPGKAWDGPVDVDMGSGHGYAGTGHWKVIGWETITVPAGTYLCLRKEVKIEYDFTAESATALSGNHMRSVSGSYQETSWYSPDARIDVKSISSDSFGDSASRELTAANLKS
jgi:hypothetical protein